MNDMPLPFEFQGKGVLDFSSSADSLQQQQHHKWKEGLSCYVGSEPTSVLDTRRSPSPPTSSSTLSSSLNTGTGATAVSEKCGQQQQQHQQLGMEDWENVLSEFTGSPTQDHSMLGYIMGDLDDPSTNSVGFNRLLQTGPPSDFEFHGNFINNPPVTSFNSINHGNPSLVSAMANNSLPISVVSQQSMMFHPQFQHQQPPPIESLEEKPHIFNPHTLIDQGLFLPLSYTTTQQEPNLILPPQPKRLNSGGGGGVLEPNQIPNKLPFSDSRHHHQQQVQGFSHQLQLGTNNLQQRQIMATATKGSEEMVVQHQQAIIGQIFKAVELVEMGNSVLAQSILARLNHQLSPIGKPFQRVAFYFKESLQQLLLHNMNNNTTNSTAMGSSNCSPFSLIFKIGAYKSFSEISPLVQFANFTCNQALLEALEGFDRIHIIDFDIGYGGQWASLMQELALRNGGPPSLKITAFASPSSHDELELELGLIRENLNHFASEISMPFELEIVSLESLNSASLSMFSHVSSNSEAIAVNLPIGSFSNYPLSLPLVLRFIKQLSPKIVVSLDRGCDRTDLSFPLHIINALQSYWSLLESIDAVNVNLDALQKIERYLLQPGIEKIVMGRHRSPEKTPPWRSLFLQSGFSPLPFSNFTESQADCLVHRTPVRGFHVEKRHSSLALCWQQKELIWASAWRC